MYHNMLCKNQKVVIKRCDGPRGLQGYQGERGPQGPTGSIPDVEDLVLFNQNYYSYNNGDYLFYTFVTEGQQDIAKINVEGELINFGITYNNLDSESEFEVIILDGNTPLITESYSSIVGDPETVYRVQSEQFLLPTTITIRINIINGSVRVCSTSLYLVRT